MEVLIKYTYPRLAAVVPSLQELRLRQTAKLDRLSSKELFRLVLTITYRVRDRFGYRCYSTACYAHPHLMRIRGEALLLLHYRERYQITFAPISGYLKHIKECSLFAGYGYYF